jgi:tetratricopeptide (TPR) repeat protein
MSNESNHGLLGQEALRLWGEGALEGALAQYTAAIDACPDGHWALFQYYGPRAAILAQLARPAEAQRDYERLLDHARAAGAGDTSSDVAIARYFLGNHHLDDGAFAQALGTITPSIDAGTTLDGLLLVVQALALHGLGRSTEARASAVAALAVAKDETKRSEFRDTLAPVMDGET